MMIRLKQKWSRREERKSKPFLSSDDEKYIIDKSKQNRNRIIFLLTITIYAMLAVLGTTDEDIFLLNPIQMPFIKVSLSLKDFYMAIPVFILILHFNAIHMIEINKKAILQATDRLPVSIFDNIYKPDSFLGFVIASIVYIFPFFVLYTFLYRFADYQDLGYTLFHLSLVIIDFLFLVKTKNKGAICIACLLMFFCIYFVWNVYLFLNGKEGEISSSFPPRLVVVNTNLNHDLDLSLLKEYAEEEGNAKPLSFLTPTNMRNRNFLYADFSYSKMYRFDFSGSNLSHSSFRHAKLPYSIFYKTIATKSDFSDSFLFSSRIEDMNASNSWFVNADMTQSHISSSNFSESYLTGVDFSESYVNANFSKSRLDKSSFIYANVSGNFQDVNLEDADFSSSDIRILSFRRAFLANTKFVGTIILGLDIRGASFYNTNFIGAVGGWDTNILKTVKTYPSGRITAHTVSLQKRLNLETNLTKVFDTYESKKKFISDCSNNNFLYIEDLKEYGIESLELCRDAIGKNSDEWLEFNKKRIITGKLTQEMIDRIKRKIQRQKVSTRTGSVR